MFTLNNPTLSQKLAICALDTRTVITAGHNTVNPGRVLTDAGFYQPSVRALRTLRTLGLATCRTFRCEDGPYPGRVTSWHLTPDGKMHARMIWSVD